MHGVPGVMARMAEYLRDAGVTVLQTADSHTTISVLVDSDDADRAVAALHEGFGLAGNSRSGRYLPGYYFLTSGMFSLIRVRELPFIPIFDHSVAVYPTAHFVRRCTNYSALIVPYTDDIYINVKGHADHHYGTGVRLCLSLCAS